MKKVLLFIFILLSVTCFAQFSKTHYIPPLISSIGLVEDQYLYISTPSVKDVSFKILENGGSIIYGTVNSTNPYIYNIGSGDNTQLFTPFIKSGIVKNKGYIIESDDLIYVSVRVNAGLNRIGNYDHAGGLVSKGNSALGKTFRLGAMLNPLYDRTSLNFASILSTENNTNVTISNIKNGTTLIDGTVISGSINITLNKNESYVLALQNYNDASAISNSSKMIGVLVSTDKPVVVNSGSFAGSNSTSTTSSSDPIPLGRDLGFDQIVSLEKTGREYIFVKGQGTDELERVLLIAHSDDTQIFLNDDSIPFTTLDSGEYIAIDGSRFNNGNLYVTTNENIFAYQSMSGSTNPANQNLFFVPPIKCSTPNTVDNIPLIQSIGNTTFDGVLNIITEAGATVFINNLPVTGNPIVITGNPQFVRYTVSGLSGNIAVKSSKQVYVSYFSTNGVATYGGYYSGFDLKLEIVSDKITAASSFCIPNVILKVNSLSSYDIFQWYKDDVAISSATTNEYTPTQPGFYQVKGSISNCISDVFSDKIPVSECPTNGDQDLANDNIDIDFDNDGILNCTESYGNQNLNLSNLNSGVVAIGAYSNSFSGSLINVFPTVPVPFVGMVDGTFVTEVPAGKGSSLTYSLNFTTPINLSLEYVNTANTTDLLNIDAEYIVNSDIDKTVTVLNPTDQLLIDTNYDGVYESGVTQFSSFEIRFRLNGSVSLPAGTGTFKFQSHQTNSFKITHTNLSDINGNKSTIKLIATCVPKDSDGDGISDQLDLDSDNDGIPDSIESQRVPKELSNIDTDLDGLDEIFEPGTGPVLDTDNDTVLDYLDLDSDNDGIYDLVESGSNASDSNQDGILDTTTFGINGLADLLETNPDNGILNYMVSDTDADGMKNHIERDSDNDRCNDVIEAGFTDSNFDGILGNNPITIDSNGIVTSGIDGYTTPNSNYIITTPIIVITQPTNQSQCLLQNAIFTIASNADGYQWQVSTDGIIWNSIVDNAIYSGTNSASLLITGINLVLNNTKYRVVLSKNNNSCGLISNVAALHILPLPTLVSPISIVQCDDNNDGITNFNITEKNKFISANYIHEAFSYYTTFAGANTKDNTTLISNPLVFTSSNTSIWTRVENSNGCFNVSQIDLMVSATQINPSFKKSFQVCDDYIDPMNDDKDGITTFDFSSAISDIQAILPSSSSAYSIKFYKNEADALSETYAIPDISNYRNTTVNQEQIWVRVDSNIDNSCFGLGAYITLKVDEKPNIDSNNAHIDDEFVCSNLPLLFVKLDAGIRDGSPTGDYTYVWRKDGIILSGMTEPTLDVNTEGVYTVEVFNINNCSRIRTVTVTASSVAHFDSILIEDLSDSNTVKINSMGSGNYEYSLDLPNGPFQESDLFENVPSGIHTVYINDRNGCGIIQKTIAVLGIPKFFTPNSDGFNDYWNIKGVNESFNKGATIFIYNRYGKLITQLLPTSKGWDGTFTGNAVPADDYWYTLKLEDGREVKGHFSLKR